ncbi:MAG: hypothetical protein Roseis2KO_52860 [Roseivirga sp.]
MKKLLLLTLCVLIACSPCKNDDCPGDASFFFQITNQDGVNLLQIPGQKYNADSVSVWLMSDNTYAPATVSKNGNSLEVLLAAGTSEIVISYGTTEQDTLLLFNPVLSTLDGCCDTFLQDYDLSGTALSCDNCGPSTHTIVKQ